MSKRLKFYLYVRRQSFGYAFSGIKGFFRSEPNAVIHLLSTVMVIILSVATGITKSEAISLITVIGFVWTAELFNTVLEKVMDFISVEKHAAIKFIKDVAAAAVLVAAFTALATGCIIFIPKL